MSLICNNYVLVETIAVLQNRLGMDAMMVFQNDVRPILTILWVDENLHQRAVSALLAAQRRRLSLVDCASFESMRQAGIRQAFAFDVDFEEQGFEVLPCENSIAERGIIGLRSGQRVHTERNSGFSAVDCRYRSPRLSG
jgi:predicted nucleic acid-binding protein